MKSLQAIRLLAAEQYGADLHRAMHVMNLGAPACALRE